MLNKRSIHTILLILLAFGLSAIVIQAAPASQAVLNSPLPTPGKFDSPLPTPALCPHITNQTASNMDAKMYASDLGVDLDTAICQLILQDLAGDLTAELAAKEVDTFAGLWVQHTPEFRIIVQFTRPSEEVLNLYTKNTPLTEIVAVKVAEFSLSELEAAQTAALLNVQDLDIPVESGINVFENRVELYVIERAQFDTALQKARIRLSNNVEVITVNELSVDSANIYAGLALRICTSGFSVMHSSGTKGVLTAAHCSNSQSYNGTSLPFAGSAEGGSYDVQWHTAPGFTVKNWAYDGISDYLDFG